MKKNLNEIFDEVKPDELELFSDELIASEMPLEMLSSIKNKVYDKIERKRERKDVRRILIRFGAMAACFILIASATIAIRLFQGEGPGVTPPVVTTQTDKPQIPNRTDDAVDSLDILNYYGGILSIKKEQADINPFMITTSAAYAKADFLNFTLSVSAREAEKQYYDIEQIQEYTITESIYFKIKVDASCSFLYQLFGVGEVDAVVTKNNIDTMITFQKNKNFYSCLYSYSGVDGNRKLDVFSTQKYIDGSYVINDSSNSGVFFYLSYEYDKIHEKYIENLMFEWNDGTDTEKTELEILTFNGIGRIESCISVQEISDYYYNIYNQGLPNGDIRYAYKGTTRDGEQEIYIHIYTSGEFYICDEKFLIDNSDPFAFYLRGMNSRVSPGHIFLQYNDENGEAVILETSASANGSFRWNGILFMPYSITGSDADNLTVLYFAAYDENGKVIKYLRADPDGTFIAGEPLYIDPYYDGYINPSKKIIEGYWGINEEGTYFIYYKGNKKITLSGIDYENGAPLNIKDNDYYLCGDPFPPDEVTDIRKTVDGYELHVTRDRHYTIFDKNAVAVEQGTLEYELDKRSIGFWVEQITDQSIGYLALVSADESIIYHDYIFYPAHHLVFEPTLSNASDDLVVRFDIISTLDKSLSLYIMRDGTFFVWNNFGGYMLYGKGTAAFENAGIQMKDFVGYGDKTELFAAWTDSETQTEFVLEGDVYRLVYDLRIK